MENELIQVIQAVKDVAPSVWAAARWAVVSGACIDLVASALILASSLYGIRKVLTYNWTDFDRGPAVILGGGVCGFVALLSAVVLATVVRHLIAPDWYTIQLLLSQLPGVGR